MEYIDGLEEKIKHAEAEKIVAVNVAKEETIAQKDKDFEMQKKLLEQQYNGDIRILENKVQSLNGTVNGLKNELEKRDDVIKEQRDAITEISEKFASVYSKEDLKKAVEDIHYTVKNAANKG